MIPRRLPGPLLVALVAAACAGGTGPAGPTPAGALPAGAPGTPVELVVFAAASLTAAMDRVKPAYEAAHPGTTVTVSTDSSAALATQIEQGAPADVFLAADVEQPRALAAAGLADGDPVPFAGNELVIVVPADNPGGVASPQDLGRPGVRIVAAGNEVPITGYAARLVANLAALSGYPSRFEAAYAANVVSREDNVKAVVAKIELGEGDAAIVYATDAAASDRVAALEVPARANVAATYAGVVVAGSRNRDAARTFLAWVAGPEGAAILAQLGFRPVP